VQNYASHKVTHSSLVITDEQGTSIAIPLAQASKLLSAVQRSLGEPDAVQEPTERHQVRQLSRIVKLT